MYTDVYRYFKTDKQVQQAGLKSFTGYMWPPGRCLPMPALMSGVFMQCVFLNSCLSSVAVTHTGTHQCLLLVGRSCRRAENLRLDSAADDVAQHVSWVYLKVLSRNTVMETLQACPQTFFFLALLIRIGKFCCGPTVLTSDLYNRK